MHLAAVGDGATSEKEDVTGSRAMVAKVVGIGSVDIADKFGQRRWAGKGWKRRIMGHKRVLRWR